VVVTGHYGHYIKLRLCLYMYAGVYDRLCVYNGILHIALATHQVYKFRIYQIAVNRCCECKSFVQIFTDFIYIKNKY